MERSAHSLLPFIFCAYGYFSSISMINRKLPDHFRVEENRMDSPLTPAEMCNSPRLGRLLSGLAWATWRTSNRLQCELLQGEALHFQSLDSLCTEHRYAPFNNVPFSMELPLL